MEHVKANADAERRDVPLHIKESGLKTSISPQGRKGGYAFVISTGSLGQNIAFKKNLSRTEWNAHVKIRALSLATLGWKTALREAFLTLEALQFHVSGINLNRVDYCMDFLNTSMTLDPRDFVEHSRVKKVSQYVPLTHEKSRISTCKAREAEQASMQTTMRGEAFESVTIGKMPGRQIIVYDKRREALDKRTFAWFKIWNIDRHDPSKHVQRIELRAGKNELDKYRIKTFDDFESRIGDVFITAAQAVRMTDPQSTDSNISRKPMHPTWLHVQMHVKEHLFDHVANTTPCQILEVLADEKAREYMAQIRGNAAGYAVCKGIGFKHISACLPDIFRKDFQEAENNPAGHFQKTYGRARDRLKFIKDV